MDMESNKEKVSSNLISLQNRGNLKEKRASNKTMHGSSFHEIEKNSRSVDYGPSQNRVT